MAVYGTVFAYSDCAAAGLLSRNCSTRDGEIVALVVVAEKRFWPPQHRRSAIFAVPEPLAAVLDDVGAADAGRADEDD